MKTVSLFLTATILFAAPALHAKMVKVPDAQAKELKEALALTPFQCSPRNINLSSAVDLLREAQSVYLDDAGLQPVLRFVRVYPSDKNYRTVFTLKTNSDFRKIELLVIEDQEVKPVNRGTLVKPQIANEFVTNKKFECQ